MPRRSEQPSVGTSRSSKHSSSGSNSGPSLRPCPSGPTRGARNDEVEEPASVDTATETLRAHRLLPVLVWEQSELTPYDSDTSQMVTRAAVTPPVRCRFLGETGELRSLRHGRVITRQCSRNPCAMHHVSVSSHRGPDDSRPRRESRSSNNSTILV